MPFSSQINDHANRCKRRPTGIGPLALVLFIGCLSPTLAQDSTSSGWSQLGPRLRAATSNFIEVDASRHALAPSITAGSTGLFLSWVELNEKGVSNVHVKSWNGRNWIAMGQAVNQDRFNPSFDATIQTVEPSTYVAWTEQAPKKAPQVFAKHWERSGWQADGSSLNINPGRTAVLPTLTADPMGRLFLGWSEENENRVFQGRVKRLDSNGWTDLGENLNRDPGRDAFHLSLASMDGRPIVAWTEGIGDHRTQVMVKRWTGSEWTFLSTGLNSPIAQSGFHPVVRVFDDRVYVAWSELLESNQFRLIVAIHENGAWKMLPNPLSPDNSSHAFSPALAASDSAIFLTWLEVGPDGISRVRFGQFENNNWSKIDTLNFDPKKPASTPSITLWNGKPVVVWKELESDGLFSLIVKQGP